MSLIAILFWILTGLVVYVYAGYPLLLLVLTRLGGARRVARGSERPTVTVLISAFNESDVIAGKLDNCLELDYPQERLQVIVISDASDDGTDAIVQGYAPRGVELLRMQERGGKTLGLNAAVERARGDILVFSDANALYAKDALNKLVRNFSDPEVGAVVGESTYADAEVESERSEGLYWKYETAIKGLESQLGSVVGGDGAIYSIRRELYRPMRADALSDFVNPLQIVKSGRRCVYESEARSFERAADNFNKEFRRKVRIVNRAWRALLSMSELLNPLRYGFFSFQLLSHKLLRWSMPLLLVGSFAANAVLAGTSTLYAAIFGLQLLFYVLAALGYLQRRRSSMPAFISVPFYFCLVNIAAALGILDAVRGRTYTVWSTARAPGQT